MWTAVGVPLSWEISGVLEAEELAGEGIVEERESV